MLMVSSGILGLLFLPLIPRCQVSQEGNGFNY